MDCLSSKSCINTSVYQRKKFTVQCEPYYKPLLTRKFLIFLWTLAWNTSTSTGSNAAWAKYSSIWKLRTSQMRDLFFFHNVEENLLIILRFSSVSSKIMAHSAGIKLGFLGRLAGEGSTFSTTLLSVWHAQSMCNLSSRKVGFITMATIWIAIYPSDS